MGFNSDVIKKAWRETMPDAFKTILEVPYMALPNPRATRSRIWVSDAASWLYSLSSPFSVGTAKTFGDILDQMKARIGHYLKDNSVNRIVFMLDCYSDPAKRYLREQSRLQKNGADGEIIRKGKAVPQTPPNGFRQFLIEESVRYHDNQKQSLPRTADGDIRDIDIVLPGTWPGSQFDYFAYLDNSEFKNHFLIPLICRNLHLGLQVPHGKEVLFRGPNTSWLLKSSGLEKAIPNEMLAQFGEPDAFVGYWMTLWPDSDFLIESEDGDVLTNLLLTSSLRQSPNHSKNATLDPDDIFKNRVTLMRNQWKSNRPNTVIDINRLWVDMYQQSSALNCESLAQLRNPIADQVLLAYLAGENDYIDSRLLPKVGVMTLWLTYIRYIGAWTTGLVLPHIVDNEYVGFHVDIVALGSFIIYCYKSVYPKLDLTHTEPDRSFELIGQRLKQIDIANAPTKETVWQLAVQLTWTMNYYANGCYRMPVPRSTERIGTLSKYGWIKNPDTGAVEPTQQVSVSWLHEATHPKKKWEAGKPKVAPSTPSPSSRDEFRAPKPDSYNQLDPILS